MMLAFIFFIVGVAVLVGGAQLLVLGASQLAASLKISSLIIGLTVVSFGTSAPEIFYCVLAAWKNESQLVIGNIVGSNILNILLVLGISASIVPLYVKRQVIRWDIPLMIGVSLIFWLLASFGKIAKWEGLLLFLGIILYVLFLYLFLKREPSEDTKISIRHPLWLQILWIFLGLIALAVGSELLIQATKMIARLLEINELFVALTVVAIGTSLPEVATSVTAAIKKQTDIAVGNAIGSNLFNLLAVLGLSSLIAPSPIEVSKIAISFDIPVMVAVSIATLPIVITGHQISRWEGVLFLLYYLLYLIYVGLEAFAHPFLPLFTTAFFFFILPLTLLTLLIAIVRHYVYRNHSGNGPHF